MPYNLRFTPSLLAYSLNRSPKKYSLARNEALQPHAVSTTSNTIQSSIATKDKKDNTPISNTNTTPRPVRAQWITPTVAHIDATMYQFSLKHSDHYSPDANSKKPMSMQDDHSLQTNSHVQKKINLFQCRVDKACHKYQLKTGLTRTKGLMHHISDQYGLHAIHAFKKEFPFLARTFTLLCSDIKKTMQFINKKKIPSLRIKAAHMQYNDASTILGNRTRQR